MNKDYFKNIGVNKIIIHAAGLIEKESYNSNLLVTDKQTFWKNSEPTLSDFLHALYRNYKWDLNKNGTGEIKIEIHSDLFNITLNVDELIIKENIQNGVVKDGLIN